LNQSPFTPLSPSPSFSSSFFFFFFFMTGSHYVAQAGLELGGLLPITGMCHHGLSVFFLIAFLWLSESISCSFQLLQKLKWSRWCGFYNVIRWLILCANLTVPQDAWIKYYFWVCF
jgi:hypothetical protein